MKNQDKTNNLSPLCIKDRHYIKQMEEADWPFLSEEYLTLMLEPIIS